MSLKKFNQIIQEEIKKAHLYEKNDMWKSARKTWLDIIEYCLLFAKKTPGLKKDVARMITNKANKLMERVERIDDKIAEEELDAGMPATPFQQDASKTVMEEREQHMEGETVYTEPEIQDLPAPASSGDLQEQFTEPKEEREEVNEIADEPPSIGTNLQGDDPQFIEVGDVKIEIPDDFPLKEIPRKDSFKPPDSEPDPVQIDKTREYVEKKEDGEGNGEPQESGNSNSKAGSEESD